MFEWLKRKVPFVGSVLYRGSSPMRPEEFAFLTKAGIHISDAPSMPNCHWTLALEHPQWGQARLICPRGEANIPLDHLFEFSTTLTAGEKKTARAYGMQMVVETEGKEANLLRDRKNALRFLRAVMADDGLAAVDYLSLGVWLPAALEEELSHDADLDIEHIFGVHAVSSDDTGEVIWVHTHGLGDIGFFDFDVVRPHETLFLNMSDVFRCIAFAIVEKKVGLSTRNFMLYEPKGVVGFVRAEDFEAQGEAGDVRLRDGAEDSGHNRNRVVLCDPGGGLLGIFSRKKVRPARALSDEIEVEILLRFSSEASALMAERARNTYGVLRRVAQEFAEMQFPIMVKLGCTVDGGGADDIEHMWFSVNEFFEDEIDGTLENQPFYIAGMKQGDRGRRSVALISDWMVMTPMGNINPRSSQVVRSLRENGELLEKMRKAMREFNQAQNET
jgi:uncharacterized protein YegJ (DUF2314 family)